MAWLLVVARVVHAAQASECPPLDERELRPLLELELGTRASLLEVSCQGGRAA